MTARRRCCRPTPARARTGRRSCGLCLRRLRELGLPVDRRADRRPLHALVRRRRSSCGRGEILILETRMTLSLNERARRRSPTPRRRRRRAARRGRDAARRHAADRLRQRGARAGWRPGAGSPRSRWAASARSRFAPLVLDGRWLPGLTVVTDHPALACLGAQYAGWQIDRDDYFAMASGPGRALIRAEDLYDDLDVDERADTRGPLPGDARRAARGARGLRGRARRRRARRPHAAVRADREPRRRRADRGARRRDRAAQAARARLRRAPRGERLSGAARCRRWRSKDPTAIGRTNDAVLYGGQVELTVDAPDDELERARRAPAGLGVGRLRRAVRQGARGGGLGLLQDRPAAVQPGRGAAGERRRAGAASTPAAWTSRRSSGRSGDDRRDGHDDDQPGRHRQLRGDGRGVGRRRRSSSSPIARHAHAAQPAAPRARRSSTSPTTSCCSRRRRSAIRTRRPGRRPAVDGAVLADACSWREVAVDAIDADGPRARVTTRVVGRGTRARVHRLQPRVPRGARGVDPRLARPPAART